MVDRHEIQMLAAAICLEMLSAQTPLTALPRSAYSDHRLAYDLYVTQQAESYIIARLRRSCLNPPTEPDGPLSHGNPTLLRTQKQAATIDIQRHPVRSATRDNVLTMAQKKSSFKDRH